LLTFKSHFAEYPHQLKIYFPNITRKTSHVLLSHQLYNIIVNSVAFQVLKEAMRLFPPIPVFSRQAIKEIDLGHGHIIPAGTNIFVSAYTIHRDSRHISDPEKFDPERFSPQNSVGRHPYAYTPFGIGCRMCVGHVFANMEAKTILSTVLSGIPCY
jgi:cytochrome P450